jgi:hypothetical protein
MTATNKSSSKFINTLEALEEYGEEIMDNIDEIQSLSRQKKHSSTTDYDIDYDIDDQIEDLENRNKFIHDSIDCEALDDETNEKFCTDKRVTFKRLSYIDMLEKDGDNIKPITKIEVVSESKEKHDKFISKMLNGFYIKREALEQERENYLSDGFLDAYNSAEKEFLIKQNQEAIEENEAYIKAYENA